MDKVIRVIDRVISVFGFIAGSIMIFLMCFTTCDIFARLFNHPILGSTEVTVVGTASLVFLGFGYCALHEGHIRVDIFKGWPWMDRVTNTIAALSLLVIAYQCIVQGNFVLALNNSTQLLKIPKFPFYWASGLGFLLIALALFSLEYKHYYLKYKENKEKKQRDIAAQNHAEGQ